MKWNRMKGNQKGAAQAPMFVAGIWILIALVVVIGGLYVNDNYLHWGGQTASVGGLAQVQSAPPSGSCTYPLSSAQTPGILTQDVDSKASILSPTTTLYLDPVAGAVAAGTTTTVPGKGYSALVSKSGFLATLIPFQTSCVEAAPAVPGQQEAFDSSVSGTFYNVGGRTANANTLAARQTLTANSPSTIQLELAPSAVKKHIAGGQDVDTSNNNALKGTGSFAVFFNDTASNIYDFSGFSANMYGGVSTFAGSCAPYVGTTPANIGGVVVGGFICPGDFDGKSTATYGLLLTVKPSSAWTAGNRTIGVQLVPVDYFKVQTTGAVGNANAVVRGPVIDNGTTVQVPQNFQLFVA